MTRLVHNEQLVTPVLQNEKSVFAERSCVCDLRKGKYG